ncbi:MAG: OmpA family protein [Alphaproteobacteria bacterium]|nr:OmpA family protein [Alphaproteobacteria bacterium]
MNNSPFKISSRVLPVVAILALSGCSDLDVFGLFEDDTPAARSASEQGLRDRASTEQAAAEGSGTPSLTSVPSRPAGGSTAVRDRVVEGLISDRDNARYSDEVIRLQGSTRPTATPQAAAAPAPTPAPAPVAPSTTPAPAPASVTPQIAVTPPPAPPAPTIRAATPTPAPIARTTPVAPARTFTPPAPVAPAAQVAAARPVAPAAPTPSQSMVVDMSALGGAGYIPVSAQISQEAQVATIQFGHSSSRLDARDRQLIATVASAYRQNGGNILVVGHASARTQQLPKSKHEVANFKVSFARANSVAQALIRAGVASESVTVEAVADGQPVYSEAMPSGEAGNRRAEIYFLR